MRLDSFPATPKIPRMFAPEDYLDLNHSDHLTLFENVSHVWDALKQIPSYLQFRLAGGARTVDWQTVH